MLTAEHMTAISKEEPGHKAFCGVDSIGKALNRLMASLVDVGEGRAADRASVDKVEGRDTRFRWCLR